MRGRISGSKQRTKRYQGEMTKYAILSANKEIRAAVTKKEFIDLYKLEKGCFFCGYSRWAAALDLHHIDPSTKAFSLANAHTRSMQAIMEEIAKCVVVYANCHRALHNNLITLPHIENDSQ